MVSAFSGRERILAAYRLAVDLGYRFFSFGDAMLLEPGAGVTFTLLAGGAATPRAGLLELPHGPIETPAFMPVGTRGTVKAIDMVDLAGLGPGMVLANTYHLWTDPGHEVVARAGGLHRWTGWGGNMLTDSGGYQAVSLARVGRAEVREEGVRFDGPAGSRLLSPEGAVEVQEALAPDVMMVLDQPVAFPASVTETEAATMRTHRWAARCRDAWSHGPSQLWGIVQGGFDLGLRRESVKTLVAMNFPGYAIGGLSLGEPGEATGPCLLACTAGLPGDRPRYLMGVGTEPEMLERDRRWRRPLRLRLAHAPGPHRGRARGRGQGQPAQRRVRPRQRSPGGRMRVPGLRPPHPRPGPPPAPARRAAGLPAAHHPQPPPHPGAGPGARAAILDGRFQDFVATRAAASAGGRAVRGRPI